MIQAGGAENAINILGNVTEQEKNLLDVAIKGLKTNIDKGVDFVKNPPPK
jgi:malate dehydrogenase